MDKKYKVIIIDDQMFTRHILKMNLEKSGFDCVEAKSAIQGLELVNRLRPDIVLLDIMMPDMNGYEVLNRLKSDLNTQQIHVIMISALGQKSDIDKAMAAGAAAYIQKPFNKEKLLNVLSDVLGEDIGGGSQKAQYLKSLEASLVHRVRTAVKQNDESFKEKLPQFFLDKKYGSSLRCEAAIAVVHFKDSSHIQYLVNALEDPDPMVREKVVWALGKLQEKRVFGKLCTMLKDSEETIDVKMSIALAIKELGFEDQVKPLLESFKKMMADQRKARREARKRKRKKKADDAE